MNNISEAGRLNFGQTQSPTIKVQQASPQLQFGSISGYISRRRDEINTLLEQPDVRLLTNNDIYKMTQPPSNTVNFLTGEKVGQIPLWMTLLDIFMPETQTNKPTKNEADSDTTKLAEADTYPNQLAKMKAEEANYPNQRAQIKADNKIILPVIKALRKQPAKLSSGGCITIGDRSFQVREYDKHHIVAESNDKGQSIRIEVNTHNSPYRAFTVEVEDSEHNIHQRCTLQKEHGAPPEWYTQTLRLLQDWGDIAHIDGYGGIWKNGVRQTH